MTLQKWRGRNLILLAVATILTLSVVVVVFSKRKQAPKQSRVVRTYKAERVTKAPAVISRVKDLQVAGVDLVDQGTSQAAVSINIINNSDEPLTSLELSAGDADDWSNLGFDGLEDPNKPLITIPAHTLKTFRWNLGAILEGYPIVISGARFMSGKEDGEAGSLEIMHKDLERNVRKKALLELGKKGVKQ
jgi:hypothetical protein